MRRPEGSLTLLDACAVVNLFATRRMEQILAAVDGQVAIADVVAREAQFVWRGGGGEDAREREPVDLRPCLDDGLLTVISTDVEEELLTFIDLALVIDEGEAMTAALAIHRSGNVVTDDRKATRVLTERGVSVRSTLDAVKGWSELRGPAQEDVQAALIDLRQRGNYEPSKSHPLRAWWDDVLALP